MKKLGLSILGLVIFAIAANAQIEVGTNNNVGIGVSGNVDSKLSVNHSGSTNYLSYFYQNKAENSCGAIRAIMDKPVGSYDAIYPIYGYSKSGKGYSFGLCGTAYNTTAYKTGRAYGISGYAGNAASGYNYGVRGILAGSNNGAGIFGTTSGDYKTTEKYAGFFYGNARVTGKLYYGSIQQYSDSTLKKRIRKFRGKNAHSLMNLSAYIYQYKTPEELNETAGTDTSSVEMPDEVLEFYNQDRIGLMAQELETEYPELVSQDQEGKLTIDYIGLIPILIEATKEQQLAIEKLANKVVNLKKRIKALENQ